MQRISFRKIFFPGTSRQASKIAITSGLFMAATLYISGIYTRYKHEPGEVYEPDLLNDLLFAGAGVGFIALTWYLLLFTFYSVKEHKAGVAHSGSVEFQPSSHDYRSVNYSSLGVNRSLVPAGLFALAGCVLISVGLLAVWVTLSGELAFDEMIGWLLGAVFLLLGFGLAVIDLRRILLGRKTFPSEGSYREFVSDNGFRYEVSQGRGSTLPYDTSGIRSDMLPDHVRSVTRMTQGTYQGKDFEILGVAAIRRRDRNKVPYYGLLRREVSGVTAEQARRVVDALNMSQEVLDVEVSGNTVTIIMWPYPPIDRVGVMQLFQCIDAIDACAESHLGAPSYS